MTYNIRRGFGDDGAFSIQRVASVVASARPDVAGLQEVWKLPVLHDQPERLARATGMSALFQANVTGSATGLFGNLVLAREDMRLHSDVKLRGGRQQRGTLLAEVTVDGRRVVFGATHFGLGKASRATQIASLLEQVPEGVPIILVGDLNASSDDELYALHERFDSVPMLPTYPAAWPRKPLDRIFFSRDLELVSAETIKSLASDHLPIVAQLRFR